MKSMDKATCVNIAQCDSNQLASRVRWISQAASASAILVGSLILVGWWLDVTALKSLMPGFPTMKANTALAFVLSGISLWLLRTESASEWNRRVAQACAVIVALVGLLTFGEYLVRWDLGVDQLLLQERGAPVPHLNSGWIAFATALNFVLLGGALLLLDVPTRRGYQHAPFLAVVVAASALLTLVAYLYGGAAIHQAYPFVTVAPHTALLFVVLSIGILFARAQHRFVDVMTSDTVAAAVMRRLMLLTIVLPIFLGWVRLVGQQRYDLYGTEFGLALIVLFGVVGLTGSIYWQAKSLIQAEVYQHGINEVSAALGRTMTLEDTFPVFATTIKKIVSYDRICVVVREGEWLVAVLSVADPSLRCFREQGWRPLGETAVEWVMAHKLPRLTRDLPREIAFADEAFVAREGIHATLILPLLVGGEAVGSLTLDSKTSGAFTQDHVSVLSGFTEPLASAVRNAQLYAQVVRYTHDLEGLVEARTRELQVANGHLAEVSRHKSAFLTNMSHELRTPLNTILGFSELLRDQTGEPLTAKQVRYADHIHASGRHLLALINDLLDLSKVEAGKLTLRPEPFNLAEALAAALQEIQPLADIKGLTFTLDADRAPATLTADPIRFKQILYNLLSNAVKFTPEGGRITVTARTGARGEGLGVSEGARPDSQPPTPQPLDGDFVEIAVIDTGIGIAAEDLPRLFERYTQLETATTKQFQGCGLGLVLTKQLVELHGGTIAVASAGPGQGSTFTVCLPQAPDASPDMGEGQ